MLTEKEIEVLKLRRANLTQVEVASRLKISQAAVSSFENNALRKLEDSRKIMEIVRDLKLKTRR